LKIFTSTPLVGDSICTLEFLKKYAILHGQVEFGPHFSPWIRQALPSNYIYDARLKREDCDYNLDANEAWKFCHSHGSKYHMSEGYFYVNNIVPPPMPHSFDFVIGSCDVPRGIALAPYSRTDNNGNKFWSLDNWAQVLQQLPKPVYVLGTSKDSHGDNDSLGPLEDIKGVVPFFNNDCSTVLALLKKCRLLVSIDTGISHLAHYLSMSNHVLLYPKACPPNWVVNPYARKYEIYDAPSNVTPQRMIDMCNLALQEFQ
jgi:Glycosyltransferase family 9 (heptosyltransferase)